MMRCFYFNSSGMPDELIDMCLRLLPAQLRAEITRYKNIADQKLRLISRLMLCRCLLNDNRIHLLQAWRRDSNNKPFVAGWHPFNISHSGNIVVFAYGSSAVGVDIEAHTPINFTELITYFHPEEREFVMASRDSENAFFEIWVRKEALLKAIGTGLLNGLNKFSCLNNPVKCEAQWWYLHPLSIDAGYTGYVCSLQSDPAISVEAFKLHETIEHIR
jgi:4'-phosphopantetheinyl transferase